jgi:uncharacterized protein YcfJ
VAGNPIPFGDLQHESKLPLNGKHGLIEKYVSQRSLENIPTHIELSFPLKYAFDELCIVDSPGVNALGGVQNRTFEYLHKANALLFVHSIEGPIEQSSFREFITSVISDDMRKNALFLILSKSGSKSEIEIDEKTKEARSLFKEFGRNRIFHVDSMLKIISDEIVEFDSAISLKENYKELEQHFKEQYKKEKRQEDRDQANNFHTKLRLLNYILEESDGVTDGDSIREHLLRSSNFDKMQNTIDEFSAQAPEFQLSELLQSVEIGYNNQLGKHELKIESLNKKRKHPQTFENEIVEIQRLLKEYQGELDKYTEEISRKYTGVNAESRTEILRLKKLYETKIEEGQTVDVLRKALVDFNDESGRFITSVTDSIRMNFVDRLKQLGYDLKSKHSITAPTTDVDGIAKQAEEKAYRTERNKTGSSRGAAATGGGIGGALLGGLVGFLVGGPVGAAIGASAGGAGGAGTGYAAGNDQYEELRVFDKQKHIANMRSEVNAAIQKVTETTLSNILSKFVEYYIELFTSAIRTLITARREALEKIMQEKASNEETIQQISNEEDKKKEILNRMSQLKEMLEDLR